MERGGKAAKKRATVAVARKPAVVMLTLWQKRSDYQPLRKPPRQQQPPQKQAGAPQSAGCAA